MREASIERKTKETEISLNLNLDNAGPSTVDTGIPFMNHMLDLITTRLRIWGFASDSPLNRHWVRKRG